MSSSQRSDRGIKAYAYHESSGTKLELERVNGVFELPVEFVPYSKSTSKNGTSGSYSSLSALEQIKDMIFVFVLETIRTGAMRVVHITVNIEETQILRIKFVLVLSYLCQQTQANLPFHLATDRCS